MKFHLCFFFFSGRNASKTKLLQARGLYPYPSYERNQRTSTVLVCDRSQLPAYCCRGVRTFTRFSSEKIAEAAWRAITKFGEAWLKHRRASDLFSKIAKHQTGHLQKQVAHVIKFWGHCALWIVSLKPGFHKLGIYKYFPREPIELWLKARGFYRENIFLSNVKKYKFVQLLLLLINIFVQHFLLHYCSECWYYQR